MKKEKLMNSLGVKIRPATAEDKKYAVTDYARDCDSVLYINDGNINIEEWINNKELTVDRIVDIAARYITQLQNELRKRI